MGLNRPAEITTREWAENVNDLKNVIEDVEQHERRLDRHSEKIKELENNTSKLPDQIKDAVSDGMEKVLTRVLEHDAKFQSLETEKLNERLAKAEAEIQERKEKKKYYTRLIIGGVIGCLVTSVLGGVLSFYIAVFLNNR